MDATRFEEILAVMHANLVDDLQVFAKQVRHEGMVDVSDYGGSAGTLLGGAKVSSAEIAEFAAAFARQFGSAADGLSPAMRKGQEQLARWAAEKQAKAEALAKLSPAERSLLGLS